MKINREVNGIQLEFKLSESELFDAYREQEHKFDIECVYDALGEYRDEDLVEEYGMTRDEIEKETEEIAYEMRNIMDKYGLALEYAIGYAFKRILRKEK